jgi:hypothetical protein
MPSWMSKPHKSLAGLRMRNRPESDPGVSRLFCGDGSLFRGRGRSPDPAGEGPVAEVVGSGVGDEVVVAMW